QRRICSIVTGSRAMDAVPPAGVTNIHLILTTADGNVYVAESAVSAIVEAVCTASVSTHRSAYTWLIQSPTRSSSASESSRSLAITESLMERNVAGKATLR